MGSAEAAAPHRQRLLWPVEGPPASDQRDHPPTGTGWQRRQLPARFGPWQTVHRRHVLWSADGTWERLLQHAQAIVDAGGVSAGTARLHLHPCSPARGRSFERTANTGLKKGHTRIDSSAPESEPGGELREALERSLGGFTTNIHLSADGKCRPLSLLITPGQRADCTQFEAVMDKIRVPRLGTGRPPKLPDSASADRAYSNGRIRTYLRGRGITHTIPDKTGTKSARLRRGSHGGRPPGFNSARYKAWKSVEPATNKIKQSRGVAAFSDKSGYIHLGTVTAAALPIWLRS
ncbi:IS5 family transposase [Streptomyces sp. NPDC090306]|uniref:IS5 family transposase n=1 Tax=Streptomyces sp. NPDC090306 TaxID=3365961 RepID=UPI003811C3EC